MDNTNTRLSSLERRVYQIEGEMRRLKDALIRRNGDVPSAPVNFQNGNVPAAGGEVLAKRFETGGPLIGQGIERAVLVAGGLTHDEADRYLGVK